MSKNEVVPHRAADRGGGGMRGNHRFTAFTVQILQNSDSPARGGIGQCAGTTILALTLMLKSTKMVIPPRVWGGPAGTFETRSASSKWGDARESPFCCFHSPNPPK